MFELILSVVFGFDDIGSVYIIGLLLPLHDVCMYVCMCLYRDEINVTRHPHPRPESACLPACNTVLIMLLSGG